MGGRGEGTAPSLVRQPRRDAVQARSRTAAVDVGLQAASSSTALQRSSAPAAERSKPRRARCRRRVRGAHDWRARGSGVRAALELGDATPAPPVPRPRAPPRRRRPRSRRTPGPASWARKGSERTRAPSHDRLPDHRIVIAGRHRYVCRELMVRTRGRAALDERASRHRREGRYIGKTRCAPSSNTAGLASSRPGGGAPAPTFGLVVGLRARSARALRGRSIHAGGRERSWLRRGSASELSERQQSAPRAGIETTELLARGARAHRASGVLVPASSRRLLTVRNWRREDVDDVDAEGGKTSLAAA
jgi:hypothetical protein